MKELKNYLHLYLGCEVMMLSDIESVEPYIETFVGIHPVISGIRYLTSYTENDITYRSITMIKPILRPLSDMNKEEKARWRLMVKSYQSYANTVKYFLDRHFDLFGLIESGLAIDKTLISTTIK